MSPVWFELAKPGSERPQTQTLDGAASGIGVIFLNTYKNISFNDTS